MAEAFGRPREDGRPLPRILIVSRGEVYGQQETARPWLEWDPPAPVSPYAASKLGGEIAAWEVARRTGLPVMVARPFPHTGPGQSDKYVVPALALRIRTARRIGAPAINTGNLDPVRDMLDVRDVARAYRLLLEAGRTGETYNVASGQGILLADIVDRLMAAITEWVSQEQGCNPGLTRAHDIRFLIGDAGKLSRDTGWRPTIPFEQTLKDLVDAQAD